MFFIAYFAIGIVQLWAGIDGMSLYFGIGGVFAAILLLIAFCIPVVGTFGVALLTYYGARYGWHWEWWQALLLAAPGIVLMAIGLAAGGVSTLIERRA